jgi:hypothetical protein
MLFLPCATRTAFVGSPDLFHAEMSPFSPAKMNSAAPDFPPLCRVKREVALKTMPVGAPPPGMRTVSGTFVNDSPEDVAPW